MKLKCVKIIINVFSTKGTYLAISGRIMYL